jgi:hypothetical protein
MINMTLKLEVAHISKYRLLETPCYYCDKSLIYIQQLLVSLLVKRDIIENVVK